MTAPAVEPAHIVTPPYRVPFTATYRGWCSCGAEFLGSEDAVRVAAQPHRDAEQARIPLMLDRERGETRRLRREMRREQRRGKATKQPKERT